MFRCIATLALSFSMITAQAGEIRIVASGLLTSVSATLTPSLQVGSPWSLDWTITDDGFDWNQTARIGEYHGLYGSFTVGGHSFDSDFGNAHLDYVRVLDGDPFVADVQDTVFARVGTDRFSPPPMDGVVVQSASLFLWGPDLSLFSGDSIANIVGLELSDLAASQFRIDVKPPVFSSFPLFGDVRSLTITSTTIVPVPQALWLLGGALAVLGIARRRKT